MCKIATFESRDVRIKENLNLEKLHLRCRQEINILEISADIDKANIRSLRFEILGIRDLGSEYVERVFTNQNLAKLKKLESLDIDLQFKEAFPLMRSMVKNGIRL